MLYEVITVVLSEYLRYSLKRNEVDTNTLSDELSNCRRYLDIEKFRFGDKLQAEFEFDADALNARVPVMILQPLYENAVKHGVYESFTPVKIKTVITSYSIHYTKLYDLYSCL